MSELQEIQAMMRELRESLERSIIEDEKRFASIEKKAKVLEKKMKVLSKKIEDIYACSMLNDRKK